jgi:Domain of unknown function (DUF4160)
MYANDHNPPHFHILGHDGREAEVMLRDLTIRKGTVDRRAVREAADWAMANRDLLQETWDDLQNP